MEAKAILSAAGVDLDAVQAIKAREQATCTKRKSDLEKLREANPEEAEQHAVGVALEPDVDAMVATAFDVLTTSQRAAVCREVLKEFLS